MDLDIHRIDFIQLQPMGKNTLQVLPLAKKKQQKVVVGDDGGVATTFYMKKGETQVEWKSPSMGRPVTKTTLLYGKDKIFCACGQSIYGYTRKGKEFLRVKTNLTETIPQMFADDNTIWTGGESIMNVYENCKDHGFVMCPDKINDLVCAPIANAAMEGASSQLSAIMAFQDKFVRVYSGERLLHEYGVKNPATALGFYDKVELESRPPGSKKEVNILYGTDGGGVGMLTVDDSSLQETFNLDSAAAAFAAGGGLAVNNKRKAGVTHVVTADIGRSGILDLCVAREDGTVEIWNVDGMSSPRRNADNKGSNGSGYNNSARLMFETCLGECVRGVDVGTVALGEYKDLVISTFSGKVLGFTADPAAQDATGAQMAELCPDSGVSAQAAAAKRSNISQFQPNAEDTKEKEKRYSTLKSEVSKLKKEVEKRKSEYMNAVSSEGIAVVSTNSKVSHSFKLKPDEACYQLTVECQSALELVSLRSEVPVDLLDEDAGSSSSGEGKNSNVIISKTINHDKDDSSVKDGLLVTYRFQEPSNRFTVNMRTVEGAPNTISCFVVPVAEPKLMHQINLPVKPLSLHEKIPNIEEKCPFNELKLSGSFSMTDMHHWVLFSAQLSSR